MKRTSIPAGGTLVSNGLLERAPKLEEASTFSIDRFVVGNAMQVTVQLPDEPAPAFSDVSQMPRKLLEAFAADGCRNGALSPGQVRR